MEATNQIKDDSFSPSSPVNLKEIFDKYIYHWPVFVFCMAIALALALLYLRYTAPVYEVKASLLIKDSSKDNIAGIKELNMFSDTRTVENEMVILRSKTLMEEVVKELHLNVDYFTRGQANSTDIYAIKPLRIQLLTQPPDVFQNRSYQIDILDPGSFRLKDEEGGKAYIGFFGKSLDLPFGKARVDTTVFLRSYLRKPIYIRIIDTESKVTALLDNLNLNIINRQTSLIGLTLKETVIGRGKDVLDKLVQVYNEAAIQDKNRLTSSSMKFIEERMAEIKAELKDIELKEQQFRAENGVIDISSQAQLFQQKVQSSDELLSETDLELASLRTLINTLRTEPREGSTGTIAGISDPTINKLLSDYSSLKQSYANLQQTTGEAHPYTLAARGKMEETKAEILHTLQNTISVLQRKRGQIQSRNTEMENSIQGIPAAERQLVDIRRQKVIKENLYLLLLQKQEEANLSSATTLADTRIIESAYASTLPVAPKTRNVFMIALLFGLTIPLGYVFIKDSLNTLVISNKDISDRTSTPILGEIIYQEDANTIVFTNNSRTAIAEQFRALRTNLQYIFGRNNGARVTLFTSSMSGEGKSFISSNLAIALAMADRKTVILELDLRKPKISKYLNLKNKTGLSNYLIGKSDKEEIIQASGIHPNLSVISSGPIPPNPAELLEQAEIEQLIAWLKTRFDDIIIDTPPIGLVTDALILARFADATMYVIRHGVTLKSQVAAIDQMFKDQKFHKLNIIHNGIKISGRYGYSYEGSYGYGYGNSYAGYAYYDNTGKGTSNLAGALKNIARRF